MRIQRPFVAMCLLASAGLALNFALAADDSPRAAAIASSAARDVGEKVPSEDSVIKDLHSLGLIEGHANIFRSASPLRDLINGSGDAESNSAAMSEAKRRMRHLYDLGIRTIVSFENPNEVEPSGAGDDGKEKTTKSRVALERAAAAETGLNYISRPIANSGKNSLEDMSDADVFKLLDPISQEILNRAQDGGVLFHCSAGHDRTGSMAAYMRLKYQHWPVDQAIDEMRRFGHNWPKFSANGGTSSWHEEHLKAIDKQLKQVSP